jgi:hypothetical protein
MPAMTDSRATENVIPLLTMERIVSWHESISPLEVVRGDPQNDRKIGKTFEELLSLLVVYSYH